MINYGVKNNYMEICPSTSVEDKATMVAEMVSRINIAKRFDWRCVASMFVKAHKWDEMVHGASVWTPAEIEAVCMRVIDMAIDALPRE